MKPGLPVWRSLLYVPVNVEKYVEKVQHARRGLHPPRPGRQRARTREGQRAQARRPGREARTARGADVAVRINRPDSMAPRDLEAAIGPDVNAIAVTKVDDAAHLRRLDELVSKLEAKRGSLRVTRASSP